MPLRRNQGAVRPHAGHMAIWYQGFTRFAASMASASALALCGTPAAAQEAPVAEQATTAAPDKFTVDSIEVAGATVLTANEIENIVYPFIGEGRTSADVDAARKALQDAYATRGFEAAVVDVPPQDEAHFAHGIIQIRVSEAPVGEVRVAGAKHHSADTVLRQLPAVVPGKPVNLKDLQVQLAEANRIPDRTVTPSFKPSKAEGAIDVELKVKDSLPLHGSIELSNDHSPNTHPLRLAASLRYTNLWGAGHTVSGSYIVTPEARSETEVFSGSYNAPLLGTPWSLVVFGYKSNSNIAALGGTQVLGNGYQVGARAIYRLSGEKTDQSFSVGFDYKDFKENLVLNDNSSIKSPIRYIPLVLGYSLSIPTDKSQFDLNLGGTLGLRVIKRGDPCVGKDANGGCVFEDQFGIKGYLARENFAHLNVDLSYSQLIADDVSLIVRFAGQYADSHLVSNEQFSIGGGSSVRGYLQSEAVGDLGIAETLQLDGPSLADSLPDFVGEFRPYAFADWGIVSTVDPLKDQQSRFGLASVGGGLRVRVFKYFKGDVAVGVPLKTRSNSRAGDARITFTARGEF